MKTIVLVRHGKAVPRKEGMEDIDRPLVDKGKKESAEIAEALKEKKLLPDLLISSQAKRAYETAQVFADTFKYPREKIAFQSAIYDESDIRNFFSIIKELDDKLQTVFVFGHEPTISSFARQMIKFFKDSLPKSAALGIGYKTENWAKIKRNQGQFLFLESPKGKTKMVKSLRKGLEENLNSQIRRNLANFNEGAVNKGIEELVANSSKQISKKFIKQLEK